MTPGTDLTDTIERVRSAVVQIVWTELAPPTASWPLGTGFFVSDSAHVITANHVAVRGEELLRARHAKDPRVGVGLAYENAADARGRFHVRPFEIVARDKAHDLALLKVNPNPFASLTNLEPIRLPAVASLSPKRPRDGVAIALSGYPLRKPVLVTTAGIIASSWAVEVQPGEDRPEIHDVYLADAVSNGGNSGGPVYRQNDGVVVGVLVASEMEAAQLTDDEGNYVDADVFSNAGISVVTPSSYVVALLEANAVEHRLA